MVCGFWPFQVLYEYHRLNFLSNLVKSNNLNKRADIDSTDYLDYLNLINKYGIDYNDSHAKFRYKFWRHCENSLS